MIYSRTSYTPAYAPLTSTIPPLTASLFCGLRIETNGAADAAVAGTANGPPSARANDKTRSRAYRGMRETFHERIRNHPFDWLEWKTGHAADGAPPKRSASLSLERKARFHIV
nr:hypothetical protein [Paenibacillus sp. PL91]